MSEAGEAVVSGAANGTVVELRGISKSYGETRANVDIDFDLRGGEIHVLLGENGAGKTTLMNIMFGHVLPDAGTIEVRGEAADIHSPHDAIELGIGMVHQHFSLVPTFSVAENIVLGSRPATDLRFRRGAIGAETTDLAERFGMPLDPRTQVQNLPVDLQQRVEILKVLYRGATILILDEPTSLLGPRQIENLLDILRDLRARGCSIVLVTHKLGEVTEVADRVTVLRAGRKVSTTERGDFDERSLTRAMTGHEIEAVESDHAPWTDDVPLLEIRNLNAPGEGADHLDDLSFMVRPGEILGVAGVEGNGQRTLVNCVCGLATAESGSVHIAGEEVTGAGTSALRSAGLAVIPEDRHSWGLILDMTVAENIAMSDIPSGAYNKRGLLDWRRVRRRSRGAAGGVRRPPARSRSAGLEPLGRQPAEGGPRPRTVPGAARPGGRQPHLGARRGRHRVRPPPVAGRQGERRRGAAALDGPRGVAEAERSPHRAVPGANRAGALPRRPGHG